ncbi:hypothetical protein M4951_14580 [Blastopirellula sp. J2-11]|uniref:hypothetical protein n=1 Tax=Blastopirellula sp. J2-11 TaxID=2943192 RepID=UPI0021C7943E|nr:hypothetical protein [Blastopirellula sp. J2-11]UUO04616.1 hypothetical protein M4951_14580 [Blastopirellula sp. J2-11]
MNALPKKMVSTSNRKAVRIILALSLLVTLGLASGGGVLGYRAVSIYPPGQIRIYGIQKTDSESIVYFEEEANTLYYCSAVSVWGKQRPWVTLSRSWVTLNRGRPEEELTFADRFSIPSDCQTFLLVGAWGDYYRYEVADLPVISSVDAPPTIEELMKRHSEKKLPPPVE